MSKQWIVAQLGAREHYLAARALHRQGLLRCLVTDVWDRGGVWQRRAESLPKAARALRNWHIDLENTAVASWGFPGVAYRLLARSLAGREVALHKAFNAQGAAFARWTARRLANEDVNGSVYFGFSSAALEAMSALSRRGVTCIVDQIDPGEVEDDLVAEERRKWAGWETPSLGPPPEYYARLRREWDIADKIVVNSAWSRDALVARRVDPAKIHVVPLAIEPGQEGLPSFTPAEQERQSRRRLKVLWLGTVILRKGFPYLIEAARQLRTEPVDFVVAGPVHLTSAALSHLPPNVTLTGKVGNLESQALRRDADVFVLPTISDGFAITQLEAMAQGLPVITTSRCGDVVRDGIDGFIIPAADGTALAARLGELAHNRELLGRLRVAARARVLDFSLERYASGLSALAP